MGDVTNIAWTDRTFNPWEGCQKVGSGCDSCYAEARNARFGGGVAPNWGAGAPRRLTSRENWNKPRRWNREAAEAGIRLKVFCASLADVFDNSVDPAWRSDLWQLISETPHLDWQLVTKRIGNVEKMVPEFWKGGWQPNIWLLITVVNQEEADRDIPKLLYLKERFQIGIVGLSIEPLLGPVDLKNIVPAGKYELDALTGMDFDQGYPKEKLDWVIVGGESGPNARPMHPDWALSLRDQCAAAGVPFFFKQWGEWEPHQVVAGGDLGGDVRAGRVRIVHPSGRESDEIMATTGTRQSEPGSRYMRRVGKKAAGALLDGREHREFPA